MAGHRARFSSYNSEDDHFHDTSYNSEDDHFHDTSLAVVPAHEPEHAFSPIVCSFNDRIRPLLDAVDKLRNLMVMEEGIQLPTIVVVGDQSSGKSSVLESLARINLPRGQGICTRVPLVMRLQNHLKAEPELYLEYQGKIVRTEEALVGQAISEATQDIAGTGKGISKVPLTLTVKKMGVPDLTMVDLPGITRVPVHGQPEDIYEQVRDIIMDYITPEASIILNVLSATVDFTTCESIRMSQSVDRTGERTLAVVTKSDKSPEGLLEKVTSDDVSIGLGYVCVRNRVGDETYEEARSEETRLFVSHPLLSKLDKSIVGVSVLAQKLMEIQAKSIDRNLPDIDRKINDKLNKSLVEINSLPKPISSIAEAMATFMVIIGHVKESLRKILLRGEFDEYPDENRMHCTARLSEMLAAFSIELNGCEESDPLRNFLIDEIKHLSESKDISLPNFLPRTAFLSILQSKVTSVSSIPMAFVNKLWDYVEDVVLTVITNQVEDYHQIKTSTRRAGLSLVGKMRARSIKWVMETLEMEKITDYTCHPEFETRWNALMAQKETLLGEVNDHSKLGMDIHDFGYISFESLRPVSSCLDQPFDLRMRVVAYWSVVLRRLVDCMALHLKLSLHNLVNKELETVVVTEFMAPSGGGIERLMEESPTLAGKRARLNGTVKKLKDSREILSRIRGNLAMSSGGGE